MALPPSGGLDLNSLQALQSQGLQLPQMIQQQQPQQNQQQHHTMQQQQGPLTLLSNAAGGALQGQILNSAPLLLPQQQQV